MPPDSAQGQGPQAAPGPAHARPYTPPMDAGARPLFLVALAAACAALLALRRRRAPTPPGTWRPLPH
jgi:hypothetical protein